MRLIDIRIRPKLLLLFILTGVLPLIIVGYLYNDWIKKSLIEESFNKLATIQTIRKGQIERYFEKSFVDIRLLADSERIYDFMTDMNRYREKIDQSSLEIFDIHSEEYQEVIKDIQKPLQDYTFLNGYSNLYLIDADFGHVMFSVKKGEDTGVNLQHGSLKNSALGQIWKDVLDSGTTIIKDFNPYPPAGNREVAFIAHPVTNKSGQKISVVVLQFTANLITDIMDARRGMGQTGESYLIGWHKQQDYFEFRSNMRTMGEDRYVVGYNLGRNLRYWNEARSRGLEGGHGEFEDSAGNNVLVAYNKLDLEGLEWYLISKIDRYEVTGELRDIFRKTVIVVLGLIGLIGICAWFLSGGFIKPILDDIHFAEAIAQGDFGDGRVIQRKDELGDLARALTSMAHSLKEIDWLKSGKENLDDQIRGELDPDEFAIRSLDFMIKHLNGDLGAFYYNDFGRLVLKASYSLTDRAGTFKEFDFGEGLVGQAALEGKPLFYTEGEGGLPEMNFGAGSERLACYSAIPLQSEGDVVGVILLGASSPLNSLQQKFLEQNIGNMAILIEASRSRKRVAELLADARIQQEELRSTNEELEDQARALLESESELQAQQEELRVTNEELEEQTKALKNSESELQAQQEELRVTNEELEERTKALEVQKNEIWEKNSDLEEAQEVIEKKMKELEVASKYKSEFLANMSHELRTPLNSILILSQLLGSNKGGNLSEKQVESASAIHSSGAELLNLINEILDLSKVEAGKIDLVIEDISLDRIESDISLMFTEVALNKGLDFKIDIKDRLPEFITTDSQRLQQIIRNLLTNAFKFTKQGKVTLAVSRPDMALLVDSTLTPQNSLAFSVTDEGIGIPEDKQATIFEAFKQADGSTSRKYGGTGLGLSISKELSRLLGGFINLSSKPGEGSTFTIVLPEVLIKDNMIIGEDSQTEPFEKKKKAEQKPTLKEPVPEDPDEVEQPVETTEQEEEYLEIADDRKIIVPSSKSLLIIEDDNNFSRVLRDFARDRGFLCIIAEDGETGLHFADYYKPSAIILDIGLPGIDGWTVMERLKDNPELRHIPVHFISAADSSMDAMRMGAVGYLTKPVSVEKIDQTLGELEERISKPVSKLLLVEDDSLQRDSIKELIGNSDVTTTAVATGNEAYQELVARTYDCMILDLGLEDMSGFELLEKIRGNDRISNVPIIVYTGRALSEEEETKLNRYTESIIIKGVKSPERLLDESALFLHRVEENLPEEKRKMLKMVHDKEAVLKGRKILLVDDDMRNVFALTSVLEEKNLQVVIARDGVECLEKLKENKDIDGILMDIMMPRMDGYEAMRQIRQDPGMKKLPIIALTAKAMKGDRAKCIEAGASDYLAKPVDPDKLLSMLRVWLY